MKFKHMTLKERFYFTLRWMCKIVIDVPMRIGNWATDKLNKSYYQLKTNL
jgi:hypothetical protein